MASTARWPQAATSTHGSSGKPVSRPSPAHGRSTPAPPIPGHAVSSAGPGLLHAGARVGLAVTYRDAIDDGDGEERPEQQQRGEIAVGQQVGERPDHQRRQHWVAHGGADTRRHIGRHQQDHGRDHQQQHDVLDPRPAGSTARDCCGRAPASGRSRARSPPGRQSMRARTGRGRARRPAARRALRAPRVAPARDEREKSARPVIRSAIRARSPRSHFRRCECAGPRGACHLGVAIICATFSRSIPTMGQGDACGPYGIDGTTCTAGIAVAHRQWRRLSFRLCEGEQALRTASVTVCSVWGLLW